MRIQVKSLQGNEYIVEVQNGQTVLDLKGLVKEEADGLAVERQKLVYKGRTMQDSNLLSCYNLVDNCKVHLILQKENSLNKQSKQPSTLTNSSNTCSMNSTNGLESDVVNTDRNTQITQGTANQPRFEIILRERLAEHFDLNTVEKIMVNLQHEIDADINSSSLDELERLAKRNLNISNE